MKHPSTEHITAAIIGIIAAAVSVYAYLRPGDLLDQGIVGALWFGMLLTSVALVLFRVTRPFVVPVFATLPVAIAFAMEVILNPDGNDPFPGDGLWAVGAIIIVTGGLLSYVVSAATDHVRKS